MPWAGSEVRALLYVITNGHMCRRHHHIYGPRLDLNITPYLKFGAPNEIEVVANGAGTVTVRELSLRAVSASAELAIRRTRADRRRAANYGRPFEPPTRRALIPLPPGAGGACRLAARLVPGSAGRLHRPHGRVSPGVQVGLGRRPQDDRRAAHLAQGRLALRRRRLLVRRPRPAGLRPARRGPDRAGEVAAGRGGRPHEPQQHPLSVVARQEPARRPESGGSGSGIGRSGPAGCWGAPWSDYYAGSGDQRILQTLETAYSGNRDWAAAGMGHVEPWPALETYTWTGNQEIAASLTALFNQDGDDKKPGASLEPLPPAAQRQAGGRGNDHGVAFSRKHGPLGTGLSVDGQREFLDAALAWHDLIERDRHAALTACPCPTSIMAPPARSAEPRPATWRLYLEPDLLLTVSGEGRLADRPERAFFNAGPATVSRDFKTHVYFQSPNRLADHSPPLSPRAAGRVVPTRRSIFRCAARPR